MRKSIFFLLIIVAFQGLWSAPAKKIVIDINQVKATVNPSMWGVFFEDINFAADGGIYAELIKNRSFEFYKPLMGWKEIKEGESATGKLLIINRGKTHSSNPRILQISFSATKGSYGISNEGFRGIGVRKNELYDFSMLACTSSGSIDSVKIQLVTPENQLIGETTLNRLSSEWKKNEAIIQSNSTESNARLNIRFYGQGVVEVDMVSLFPQKTWKNRKGGLRADLVQLLYDLQPGFIRFPGGCIVEGNDLANRYQWKHTIGPVETRQQNFNLWNDNFKEPFNAPDYFQSYGLGFYEYFLLCKDIGAEPLPILNCGMGCQWKTAELCDTLHLEEYIQDMLDLIEFANGSSTTRWGKIRADMGHPEPFNMKMLGIGNEQWLEQYIERYTIFANVLKQKHPEITLISSSGPSPDDSRFHFAWKVLSDLKADIIDEHYYMSPEWFLSNATRYDSYNRSGPKVFAGEFAAHVANKWELRLEANNWEAAIAEAAFMTGLERNADIVTMASYAPLLANINAWQWFPNCIWFNNLESYGTPNYYVQKMFANNKGTHVVELLQNGSVIAGNDSLYANAVIDKNKRILIVKIVNNSQLQQTLNFQIKGVKSLRKSASTETMISSDLSVSNSVEQPLKISPVRKQLNIDTKNPSFTLGARSFTVLKINYTQ